jgi:hypothetical protein
MSLSSLSSLHSASFLSTATPGPKTAATAATAPATKTPTSPTTGGRSTPGNPDPNGLGTIMGESHAGPTAAESGAQALTSAKQAPGSLLNLFR